MGRFLVLNVSIWLSEFLIHIAEKLEQFMLIDFHAFIKLSDLHALGNLSSLMEILTIKVE